MKVKVEYHDNIGKFIYTYKFIHKTTNQLAEEDIIKINDIVRYYCDYGANVIENQIERIIQEKQELIIDAQGLLASNPELSSPLQVLIDQNSAHIEALAKYSPSTEHASPSPSSPEAIDLSALTTRCAVLSTNHLNTACRLAEAELSRVVSLIAGSEMQHHALLTGYIA